MEYVHQPVLLREVITYLNIQPEGIYVDATFGRGGHAEQILNRLGEDGFLLAIDKDPHAIKYAQEHFKNEKFQIKQGPFSMLQTFVNDLGLANKVNGILLDLGVSSPQLDEAARGFSFLQDGPLDMRMDPSQSLDAATWVNKADEREIARVLWEYGEERYARRIAKAIIKARILSPITRTKRLAEIISKAIPAWEKHRHPATRSFQAIRIHVNNELQELKSCLEQSLSVLAIGGRLAVISFHSLEDRLVKQFIRIQQQGEIYPRGLPLTQENFVPRMKRIAWGIQASDVEKEINPRSRSAILRVAEKIR
jgi:16S rRNA (cytosine1402-N4)-methyltransferase